MLVHDCGIYDRPRFCKQVNEIESGNQEVCKCGTPAKSGLPKIRWCDDRAVSKSVFGAAGSLVAPVLIKARTLGLEAFFYSGLFHFRDAKFD